MNYRPICDVWILARSKTKYYGAYPAGFLGRARDLLGVGDEDAVLHVCAGKVRDYPFRGLGKNDKTVDIDYETSPDFIMDVRDGLPVPMADTIPAVPSGSQWPAIIIDRPYTPEDAAHYACGAEVLPNINDLVKRSLAAVRPGGRVGYWTI